MIDDLFQREWYHANARLRIYNLLVVVAKIRFEILPLEL
jgi:hypothetical protein